MTLSLLCRSNTEDNEHIAYAVYLNVESAAHRSYHPNFVLKNHKANQQAHRRRWRDTCVEIETDWYDRDLHQLRAAEFFGPLCVHAQ